MATKSDTSTHPPREPRSGRVPPDRPRPRWSLRLALAWSVVATGLAVAWATGVVASPFDGTRGAWPGADVADPLMGVALTLTLGVVGIACASATLHGTGGTARRAVVVAAWAVAAADIVVMVPARLIQLLGYTVILPVLGWFVPPMVPAYGATVANPQTLLAVYFAAGGLLWVAAAIACTRRLRGGCLSCGRRPGWSPGWENATRARALWIGRIAVAVAVASALLYPSVRLPWLFGVPVGMSAESLAELRATPGVVATGIGLGGAALGGALLMLGLVRNWGVRFPRWIPRIAGRRVPVALAVAPASVVAIGFATVGRDVVVGVVTGAFTTPVGENWYQIVAVMAMLPWGVALGVATAAYAVRRRTTCSTCNRGLPERLSR